MGSQPWGEGQGGRIRTWCWAGGEEQLCRLGWLLWVTAWCGSIPALMYVLPSQVLPQAPLLANQHQFFSGKLYVLL